MKVTLHDPITLAVLKDAATGFDFGTVFQGNHSDLPLLLHPAKTSESSFTQLTMFLQNDGGLTQSNFGYYQNAAAVSGITGTALLSDNFVRTANPTATGTGGVDFNPAAPEYMWLDVELGSRETGSFAGINFRFIFEFN